MFHTVPLKSSSLLFYIEFIVCMLSCFPSSDLELKPYRHFSSSTSCNIQDPHLVVVSKHISGMCWYVASKSRPHSFNVFYIPTSCHALQRRACRRDADRVPKHSQYTHTYKQEFVHAENEMSWWKCMQWPHFDNMIYGRNTIKYVSSAIEMQDLKM